MTKMSLGYHTEEKHLFLKEMTCERCNGGLELTKSKKGKGVGKLRAYGEGRTNMRKKSYGINSKIKFQKLIVLRAFLEALMC